MLRQLLGHVPFQVLALPVTIPLHALYDPKCDREEPGALARASFEICKAARRHQKNLVNGVVDPVITAAEPACVTPHELEVLTVEPLGRVQRIGGRGPTSRAPRIARRR